MDVDQAAAREYLFEFIAIELIQAGAATDDYGFDVEVVQCVGNSMEKDPIIRGDFFRLVICQFPAEYIVISYVYACES